MQFQQWPGHNTKLCSNRLVTEAGLPAEGTAGLHERLVVPARQWFQQWAGLEPVGRAVSALRSAHTRAAKPRACQDVVPFSSALAVGVSARMGSIGCVQAVTWSRTRIAGRVSARWCASAETGYPHRYAVSGNARRKWSSSASGLWREGTWRVPFRVCGAPRRTSTKGLRSPVQQHFAEWERAWHNTKLCSYRLVTEAGLPAEGTAGLHERLVVPPRW